MTNHLLRARTGRSVLLILLTAGLHGLALLLVAPRLGIQTAKGRAPPAEIEARLIAAPPPKVVAVPPPRPRTARRRIDPLPPAAIANAVAEPAPATVEPALAAVPGDTGAAAALTDVESIKLAVAPVEPAQPPASQAIAGRAYRADLPPSARMLLDVRRKDADGTLWHGEAAMSWQVGDGAYSMKLEAGIRMLVTRVNLVVLESRGEVGPAGFIPRSMTERRRGRDATTTRFGPEGDKISFTASGASYPVAPGTQDKATVPLELAAIARADSGQLKGNVDMLVGEDKDASVFRFVLVGEEEIVTPMGKLATWHLSRPPRAGAYGSRLDVWLAPSLGWVPVRIDNIEASGAETSQTIKQLDRQGAG
jgi:hypothetical protein